MQNPQTLEMGQMWRVKSPDNPDAKPVGVLILRPLQKSEGAWLGVMFNGTPHDVGPMVEVDSDWILKFGQLLGVA